jgi:guanylate kinase
MSGRLVIISAPSGGGKNAIIRVLVEKIPKSVRFLTTITRPMRPGEVEGIDYHYISKAEFEQKILAGDFVEYNVYAGEYYGTDRLRLEQTLKDNEVVFLQIDINGRRAMKKSWQNTLRFLFSQKILILFVLGLKNAADYRRKLLKKEWRLQRMKSWQPKSMIIRL